MEGGMHMDALKLLIADGNEEFRLALTQALQGAYYVRSCCSGKEALALLHAYNPDVLVLDLMLPELDGISLLQSAVSSGIRPMVLATTPFLNDYVLDSAQKLGVGYMIRKPCDISATVARIRDLSQRLQPPPVSQPDPRTNVTNLLLSLGVPTKLHGYGYLREAILLMAKDPGQSITKELYPKVAALCGCEAKHVERSSRNAIEAAWHHRDDRIWQLYFQPGPDGSIHRPSNGAFISRLADSLLLSQG